MNNLEKDTKIAALESQVDMIETELTYIHELLLLSGFPQGIETLKTTVSALLNE